LILSNYWFSLGCGVGAGVFFVMDSYLCFGGCRIKKKMVGVFIDVVYLALIHLHIWLGGGFYFFLVCSFGVDGGLVVATGWFVFSAVFYVLGVYIFWFSSSFCLVVKFFTDERFLVLFWRFYFPCGLCFGMFCRI